MTFFEIILIGIGLSMDAFAVSICKGLSMRRFQIRGCLIAGAYFGLFQGLMPLIGYFVGSAFASAVERFAPYITFVLLAFIGGKMIKESFDHKVETEEGDLFTFGKMLPLAVATSIDALATGVTFAVNDMTVPQALYAVLIIAVTTFLFSFVGVKIGNVFGAKYKSGAELVGGIILVAIGVKFLVESFIK